MARYGGRLVTLAILGLAAGCVPQEKYNALKLDRDRYAEQLTAAQADASAARAQAEAYQRQLQALMGNGSDLNATIQNLTQQNAELQRQLDDINRRYAEAMGRQANQPALPEPLDNAIRQFAQQNPDLVEYDPIHGVVKFKSDVTFASGQATLTPHARQTIDRFSQILNSPDANGYELIVAGHTDNVPVSNPATIAAGHKDNWYLSAHRAISVADELMKEQVSPQRIAVTGYADQRPVASNATAEGRAQNRRVEVLILPTTVKTGPVAPAAAVNGSESMGGRRPSLGKDSVVPQSNHRTRSRAGTGARTRTGTGIGAGTGVGAGTTPAPAGGTGATGGTEIPAAPGSAGTGPAGAATPGAGQ